MLRCLPALTAERTGRDVLSNRGAGADVRPFADRDRRDQLRVAADEGAIRNRRDLLPDAVVVARDRPGADVDARSDHRVAEIREMRRFGPFAEDGLLQLDEVADLCARPDMRVPAEVRERADRRVRSRRCYRSPGSDRARRTRSPIVECTIRTPEWTTHSEPRIGPFSSDTPGLIIVSAPTCTSRSM